MASNNPGLRAGGPPGNVTVPAGQAILWSVGPDRTNQVGMMSAAASGGSSQGDDLIYPVPVGFRP